MAHLITFLTCCKKAVNPLKVAEGTKVMQVIRTGTSGANSMMMPNVMTVTCEARGHASAATHTPRTDTLGNA